MGKVKFFMFVVVLFLFSSFIFGWNGQIVLKKQIDPFKINLKHGRKFSDFPYLKDVKIFDITYLSDGLKVKGYLTVPVKIGKYPCVIYNRGGNRSFGALSPFKVAYIMARVASWGYVVVGSQYRGNMGGEGKEEFGGRDVDDILNLIPLLRSLSVADTGRIGIFGWSRGGMMTYLTLKKTNCIKAAVVGGGLSDLWMMMKTRPEMEDVYRELIPDYINNRKKALDARSAIKWPEKICKTTPILMLHGTSDWRVVPQMAIDLASAFLKVKQPFRLVMFEGADHGIEEYDDEVFQMTKKWFDRFVKNNNALPDLSPHGR